MTGDDTTQLSEEPRGPLRWTLLVAGDGPLRRVALPERGTVTIGRDESCHVALHGASISKCHARLEMGESPRIADLGSKNGTRLRGERLSKATLLAVGEVVEIGSVTLVLQRTPEVPMAEAHPGEPLIADPAMERLYALIDNVAPSDLSVIVIGETGTGKEMVAARIHQRSERRSGPLVRLNCAALPITLFEAELFGHDEGAFTGAKTSKRGLIEEASGGTLFLDEIGEMPLEAQAKVLRAIEDRAFYRVGGRQPVSVDVRFLAATSRDLPSASQDGTFRADLYHRLNGITLRVPSLRERSGEVLPLAERFVTEAATSLKTRPPAITEAAVRALLDHPWTGNVRELKNTMQRAVLLGRGAAIEPEHLLLDPTLKTPPPPGPDTLAPPAPPRDLRSELQALERQRIVEALEANAGNQTRAAAQLGLSRRTLIARLETYEIARPSKPNDT